MSPRSLPYNLVAGGRQRPVQPRRIVLLALATLVALVATFVAPPWLAGGDQAERDHLATVTEGAITEYWHSGRHGYPHSLAKLVDYWTRFHVAKTVLATLTLVMALSLGVLAWRSLTTRRRSTRATSLALGTTGLFATLVCGFCLLAVMANIQGALAPLSSLLSVPSFGHGTNLQAVSSEMADGLAHYRTARPSPPLTVMVDDFRWYHEILAVLAGALALVSAVAAWWLWRALRQTDQAPRSTKIVNRSYTVLFALLTVAEVVLCVGNITVANDSAHALLTLVRGEPSL